MNIHISNRAVTWFKEEMAVKPEEHVRFFVRYGGSSPIQEGFSLGVNKEEPLSPGLIVRNNDMNFFVEERDVWYFNDHDLYVDYNEEKDEILYEYKKNS